MRPAGRAILFNKAPLARFGVQQMLDVYQLLMKRILFAILCGVLGAAIAVSLITVIYLGNRPDLKPWHEVILDGEFSTDSPVSDINGYLAIETRLFRQLKERIVDRLPPAKRDPINRYHRGSLTDPGRCENNWNRTFELTAAEPVAGILLLHGMSDSPYSLRALGQRLNENGAWVLGLRLPGHGTIPSGLVRITWEDMAAAVRLAMRHMRTQLGDKPLYIIGYSTGGALAVEYALEQIDGDGQLPPADRLVLISPAIGVSRMAALAVWQGRLGRWLGIDKLLWNTIQPEYNSYKYTSFAINAGEQVSRLTTAIQQRIRRARQSGTLSRFPPVLTFQSVVDATVSTPAIITGLYRQLVNPGNALVLFDINRHTAIDSLMTRDPLSSILPLIASGENRYNVSLVTNESRSSRRVAVVSYADSRPLQPPRPLDGSWPAGVHSLSHIALPFPEDDPLYGDADTGTCPGITLGKIVLLGERGVINIPANEILRLRWNPFYPYLKQRVMAFLDL